MPQFKRIWAKQKKIERRLSKLPKETPLVVGGFIASISVMFPAGYRSWLDVYLIVITSVALFVLPLAYFISKDERLKKGAKKWQKQLPSECSE